MTDKIKRLGLRIPAEINAALKEAADRDYMTKNQKAVEIFKDWMRAVRKPQASQDDESDSSHQTGSGK